MSDEGVVESRGMSTRLLLLCVCVIALLVPHRAQATSWIVPTWEQLAQDADFIGVVECVTAGGIVARYRVEESLKGMAVGTEFLMQEFSDSMGDHYPVRLCGERMLVMAGKIKAPMERNPTDLFGTIPADYFALFFGTWEMEYLPALKASFGDSVTSVKEAEAVIQKFLEASEDEKERRVILSILLQDCRRFLNLVESTRTKEPGRLWDDFKISEEDLTKAEARLQTLQKHTDAKALIKQMLEMVPDEQVLEFLDPLERGGGPIALELIKAQNTDGWPEERLIWLHRTREAMSNRLNGERQLENPVEPISANKVRPSEDELMKYRQTVNDLWPGSNREKKDPLESFNPDAPKAWDSAVENLVVYDPGFLVGKLTVWTRSDDDTIQSVMIRLCMAAQGDRAKLFTQLQEAQDPFIRVMAAIYLCFENKAEGLKHLRQHTRLPDDAGAWAALTLARRGEKEAMPRALEVFVSKDEREPNLTPGRGNFRFILQQRLLALLSNSAKRNGLPAFSFENYATSHPEFGAGEARDFQIKAFQKWWTDHSATIELHDPWMAVLEKEKRD